MRLKLLLGCAMAVFFCSCAAGPHMRMDVPEDSADYNGMKVFLHDMNTGDFGQSVATDTTAAAAEAAVFGNVKDLITDSMPNLEYRIGPLDMVQVVVWEHPELTSPMGQYQPAGQKVTTDGKLFYPYAGELQAAGLTAQELRTEITKRLSDKILNDPQVDVRVTGYNSLKLFVSGEVRKPGYISFDEKPMTLPVALAEAGGFTDDADLSMIQIRRDGKIYNLDYSTIFASDLPVDKILLKPNDKLYVSSKKETQLNNRVYVLGEVQRTGVIEMYERKLTLMDALATSGGLQAVNASSRSIYVIRNTSDERIDVFHLNAKNAMALAMANKFNLTSHDLVYVDASDLVTWNRIMGLILPTSAFIANGASALRNIEQVELQGW
ncbi:MAG: polysaccharide biosynthesis/export family protein [Fibrobacter sp.]|uniref:polysaccharide biosynthesis/export family protein n=1 Tax=Fibrobacter sp. TaxID=35828 RepID=UPI001B07D200|nr:polysaccharide biosynthesis/export family protein [Fibrobacter sp.]MBO7060239.1 polysaccharide biosynthesis/export family protein [Fibrobacter sp.]